VQLIPLVEGSFHLQPDQEGPMEAGHSASEVARRQKERAERLNRSAEKWQRGADGEAATAVELSGLDAAWTVLHDLPWPGRPRANIDHVVIGRAGIFVIDTKNWTGSITAVRGELRQNGRSRRSTVHSAGEAAAAIHTLV